MPNTLTDVQIFNQALLRLGQTAYFVGAVDGTDTSKYGTLAYPLYYMTRDEELRSGTWKVAKKRAQLSPANVTSTSTWVNASANLTVGSTVGILPGWLVTNAVMQGGGVPSVPAGIQAGTLVVSITDATHLVMSLAATANGTGPLVFQVNNLTGYWYAYTAPTDILSANSILSVFPNFVYMWPFKVQHTLKFQYIYEAGYFYTDLDPSNGNPVVEYIVELTTPAKYWVGTLAGSTTVAVTTGSPLQSDVGSMISAVGIPLGTYITAVSGANLTISQAATASGTGVALTINPQTTFDFDFAEALALRIAGKLCFAVTGGIEFKRDINAEYGMVLTRAAGNNAREARNDALGAEWWYKAGRR